MVKALVIGSCGFIGSNICKLLGNKYEIRGVDDLSFGSYDNVFVDTIFTNAKDLNKEFLNEHDVLILSFCSNIIYAAKHPEETYKNNILTAQYLIYNFRGHIINLSTSSVYGNSNQIPTNESAEIKTRNAYDTSKYIIEEILGLRGNYTTLRLSNVYGEYQRPDNEYSGVMAKFIYGYLKKEKPTVYGNDTRDYTYVKDVVDAVDLSIKMKPLNTEINIGTGIETSINNLLELIGIKEYNQVKERPIDGIKRRCLDISKAKELLCWSPNISLSEGIIKTKDWIGENY